MQRKIRNSLKISCSGACKIRQWYRHLQKWVLLQFHISKPPTEDCKCTENFFNYEFGLRFLLLLYSYIVNAARTSEMFSVLFCWGFLMRCLMVCKTIKVDTFFSALLLQPLETSDCTQLFHMQYKRQMKIREIRCELNLRYQVCLKTKQKPTTLMSFQFTKGFYSFSVSTDVEEPKAWQYCSYFWKECSGFSSCIFQYLLSFKVFLSEFAFQAFKLQNPVNWRWHCWSWGCG